MKASQISEAVTQARCAHPSCHCLVTVTAAIVSGGRFYCMPACAQGHGCDHRDCGCAALSSDASDPARQ